MSRAIRRTIPTALVSAIVLVLLPGSVHAQTAQLSRSAHTVSEVSGFVTIEITLSDPATEWGGVSVQTNDGDALAGEDYVETTAFVEWYEGESASRYMTIPILDDAEIETDHSFEVEIVYANGVTIGSPQTASITILDNDGPGDPVAFIDPMGATENPQGEITFFGPSGGSVDITVRLDRMPPQPYTVDFASDFEPASGTLTFDGTNEQTVTVFFPSGHADFVEGVFSLVGGARLIPAKDLAGLLRLWSMGQVSSGDCAVCMLLYFANFAGVDECPLACERAALCSPKLPSLAGANRTVEVLHRYRDEILASTETGQFYINFFNEHQANLTGALVERPTFIYRVYSAQASWVDALSALVNGNGAITFISFEMRDDLLALLDEFQELADPDTATALQQQRAKLQLDSIAGMSMAQFQFRIETLGGEVSTETETWGSLKVRY